MIYDVKSAKQVWDETDEFGRCTKEQIEDLKDIGFVFEKRTHEPPISFTGGFLPVAVVCNTTPYTNLEIANEYVSVEFKTIQELQKFIKKFGSIIIREEDIIIYNDYIE